MTENEAIEVLKQPCYCDYDLSANIENCDVSSCDKRYATRMAIKALEEIQQYRAIGTIEEFKAFRSDDFTEDLLNMGYTKGYNKAIDEFANKCKEKVMQTQISRLEWFEIDEIAEQMKGGRNE